MAAIVLFCLALLVCIVLGTNILYALLAGLVIFTLYGKKQGFSWKELGKMICSGVKTSASVLLVFPLIGILTAFWRACGTLPFIICCAVDLIRPEILLLDEPLGALDLKLRKEMQLELKRLQREMNITFIYVTHDQEEALTMSDTVVVMNGGKVQQIGTPEDIYNEPKNAFVADFIGESNILNGTMVRDRVVKMYGKEFPCVDGGFAENEPVDVVIRPEDIDIVPVEQGQLVGTVTNVTFKGMQYDIIVDFRGFKWLIQTTDHSPVGARIGVKIDPEGFHIMKKSEYSGMFGDYSSYSEEYEELADAGAEPEEEESEDEE